VNPATPFYPAEDTTCCLDGASLLAKLVIEEHLDCSGGRPCVVTTGTAGKGTMANSFNAPTVGLSGSIPPEISMMQSLQNV